MKKQTILSSAILALALNANASHFAPLTSSEGVSTMEQKCGEKKAKDHKCGAKDSTKMNKDHKCGEGKCGNKKGKKKGK